MIPWIMVLVLLIGSAPPKLENCTWRVTVHPEDWVAFGTDDRGVCVTPDVMNGMPGGPDWIITSDAQDYLTLVWDTNATVPTVTCVRGDCP